MQQLQCRYNFANQGKNYTRQTILLFSHEILAVKKLKYEANIYFSECDIIGHNHAGGRKDFVYIFGLNAGRIGWAYHANRVSVTECPSSRSENNPAAIVEDLT